MKRKLSHIFIAASLLVLSFLSGGCNAIEKAAVEKISQIKITSFKIDHLSPVGLKGLEGEFLVGIDNPTVTVDLSGITANILYRGEEFGRFQLDSFVLKGHSNVIYPLTAHAKLNSITSFGTLMQAVAGKREDFAVRIEGTGKALGVSKFIVMEFTLNELLEMMSKTDSEK
ncbi:MAG: hypothetical protein ACI39U_03690 [Candidatus Cryptobacteroides sp.]